LANNRITGKAIRRICEQHSGAGKQLLSSLLPRNQLNTTRNPLCDYWLLVESEGQNLITSGSTLALPTLELPDTYVRVMVVYHPSGFYLCKRPFLKIHKSLLIAVPALTLALLTACGGGSASSAVVPQPVTAAYIEQYTPDKANWTTLGAKTLAVVKAQDPDSITWLTKPWPKWDGTVYDPTKLTPAAFYSALFPNGDGDQLIGLREVFYQYKPFADNRNPTKAEVDEWHRIAINHLRSLVGYTSANLQVKPDHALFIRALWGDERNFTQLWDKYPGVADSAYGPCVAGTNPHCGATFFPSDPVDQAP
jgi:hypothetical protein